MEEPKIEDLVGLTLVSVTGAVNDERITFTAMDGAEYALLHVPDCCESVFVEDIVGNLQDLVGSPILIAREDTNTPQEPLEAGEESFTWTFYNLATVKGHVTLRWYGSSNGYYSEGVDFVRLK
jgi:hypothetical protein